MKLDLYLPKTLNNLPDLNDIISDPIFYMDVVMLHWFKASIVPYFKDIPINVKLFVGEKAFNPQIEKPPIFVIYNTTGYAIDDSEWLSGPISMISQRMNLSRRGEDEMENVYAEASPAMATYTIDALLDTEQRVNLFNLWYMDLFRQIRFIQKTLPGINILNQRSNTYRGVPFFMFQGGNGFDKGFDVEGYGQGDVMRNPSAQILVRTPMFRDMGSFPEAKKLIIDVFATNMSDTSLWMYDPITSSYKTADYALEFQELIAQWGNERILYK